jgi:hypothetical protein
MTNIVACRICQTNVDEQFTHFEACADCRVSELDEMINSLRFEALAVVQLISVTYNTVTVKDYAQRVLDVIHTVVLDDEPAHRPASEEMVIELKRVIGIALMQFQAASELGHALDHLAAVDMLNQIPETLQKGLEL